MEAHIKSHSEGSTSSGSSTTSDKEYAEVTSPPQIYEENRYYTNDYLQPIHYATSGVDLLAAAASVTEDSLTNPTDVINLITNSRRIAPSPPLSLRHPVYFTSPMPQYDVPLDHGNDIRRRVEAALAVADNEPLLTPPSSNPVSPAPSSSPDPIPIELVATRQVLSLPPRKRSKMILKSMESEAETTIVRYSSVIQYAKAS